MDFYTNVCRSRDKILAIGYKNGKKQKLSVSYRPNLFIPSKKSSSPYKALDGRPLEVVNLNSMAGAKKFKDKYQNIDGFEVHGYDRYVYTYISDKFPGKVEFDPNLIKIATLDIECESEDGFPEPSQAIEKVNAISIKPFGKSCVVFGLGEWETESDVIYHNCSSEKDLLAKFMQYWREEWFDIITGWNVNAFDITYLCNRVDRLFGEDSHKKFSPWGQSSQREFLINGYQKQQVFDLSGVNVVDYLELYRKSTFHNQESYKLDYIAHFELGKKKLDYSEYGSLHTLYKNNYAKYLEYNVRDVVLVEELEDKLGFLDLTQAMAYDAKCNYIDTFGMVKYWETIIYNFLKEQGVQTPPQKKNENKNNQIVGAFVKEPIKGGHNWVMSFDLNSLYPHLIMQWNISPEKMIKGNRQDATVDKMLNKEMDLSLGKKMNTAIAPNGVMFSRDKQGFFPEIMEVMYDERKAWKKKMIEYQQEKQRTPKDEVKRRAELDTLIKRAYNNQQVRKIALNSAYGSMANQWFAFFSVDLAEAITTAGQLVIRWSEKTVNEYLNKILKTDNEDYVIAIDTDSIYLTMDKFVKEVMPDETDKDKIIDILSKVEHKIEDVLEEGFLDLADYVNAFQQKMEMGREVIADRGIWTAKKRYILNVHDNEGVRLKEPKLKLMGIETAKSSTPLWVRRRLEDAIKVVMTGTEQELWEFVEKSRKEFRELPPEDVAFPRGCRGLIQYADSTNIYSKGTPIHVRGSLLFNHRLKEMNLTKRYEPIMNGEKIHFTYLTMPNPLNENVISFTSSLPREFDLHRFVDYDMQFDKSFVEPLKNIVQLINWNVEPTASLDTFFA